VENTQLIKLYNEVTRKIRPQIQGLKRGILYKTIQILLDEETSETQEKTQSICEYLGIKPNDSQVADEKIVRNLVDAVFINRQTLIKNTPGKELIGNLSKVVNNFSNDNEENMNWIIVTACTLVGAIYCKQYLSKNQHQKVKHKQNIEKVKQQVVIIDPIPADLCLVVPAFIASNFKNGSKLTVDELIDLIDNASYFLCTTLKNTELHEKNLEITEDFILHNSKREVYIKINIYDGNNLIDQKITYYLKSNLPRHTLYTIKQLVCLKSLSGLEKFNRV
jgi:hypothetical protein